VSNFEKPSQRRGTRLHVLGEMGWEKGERNRAERLVANFASNVQNAIPGWGETWVSPCSGRGGGQNPHGKSKKDHPIAGSRSDKA